MLSGGKVPEEASFGCGLDKAGSKHLIWDGWDGGVELHALEGGGIERWHRRCSGMGPLPLRRSARRERGFLDEIECAGSQALLERLLQNGEEAVVGG